MYQTTVGAYILKVHKPVFSGRCVYPTSLMRAVDGRLTLCQHRFPFIRAIYVFRTKHYLPACGNPTCRMEDVVITVAFIEFRTFARLVCFVTIEYDARRGDGFRCFLVQLAYSDNAFQSGTATCVSVYQIDSAVFVPQRTGVDNAFSGLYQYRFTPRTFRFGSFRHECTLVGVAPEYIEFTVVMADTRSPHAVSVFRTFVVYRWNGIGKSCSHDAPVYQVFGMKNLKPRNAVEAGRSQIIIFSHTAYVRVGIIGI